MDERENRSISLAGADRALSLCPPDFFSPRNRYFPSGKRDFSSGKSTENRREQKRREEKRRGEKRTAEQRKKGESRDSD